MSPSKSIDSKSVSMMNALRQGFWFYCHHNGHHIAAHASGVSGRETIYVDDTKVSTKVSWRFISSQEFSIDGVQYRVEFHVTSIWQGRIVCRFYADDVLIEETENAMAVGSSKLSWKTFVIFFLAGAVFGYVFAKAIIELFIGA
ncbi:hypothetical protein [Pseudidiomarina aestuarii]|uniref:hypothetical protein n=1 Tax=Pseudidiomarina aestuarii TaxID=624146 RepID=UPI003A98407D